jgi:hypothetical protein
MIKKRGQKKEHYNTNLLHLFPDNSQDISNNARSYKPRPSLNCRQSFSDFRENNKLIVKIQRSAQSLAQTQVLCLQHCSEH